MYRNHWTCVLPILNLSESQNKYQLWICFFFHKTISIWLTVLNPISMTRKYREYLIMSKVQSRWLKSSYCWIWPKGQRSQCYEAAFSPLFLKELIGQASLQLLALGPLPFLRNSTIVFKIYLAWYQQYYKSFRLVLFKPNSNSDCYKISYQLFHIQYNNKINLYC